MSNQNQNNEISGLAMIAGFFGVALAMMVFFFIAVLAFASLVLTIIALCAWNNPVTLMRRTVYPGEARAFVKQGLLGMVLLPSFVLFCSVVFQVPVIPEAWVYFFIGGYTAGSVGVEWLKAEAEREAAANVTYLPPTPPAPPPASSYRPMSGPPPQDFRFADWNDEEGPR